MKERAGGIWNESRVGNYGVGVGGVIELHQGRRCSCPGGEDGDDIGLSRIHKAGL